MRNETKLTEADRELALERTVTIKHSETSQKLPKPNITKPEIKIASRFS